MKHGKNVKQWVDVLVKPVLLMMNFVHDKQEGDWLFHLATYNDMMPY